MASREPTGRRGTVGLKGEEVAARFLRERGCEILRRNVRADGGEIDLIVRDGSRNIVVEVKTSTDGSDPIEAVDERKMDLLARTAGAVDIAIGRFDLVGVSFDREGVVVRWLKGVDGTDPM